MNFPSASALVAENPLDFMTRATPQLRAAVEQHQATLPAGDFAEMMATIRSLFEKYSAKLFEFEAGADRAAALHQMMDRELKATAQLPLSCGKGCAGCCSYEVEITDGEAVLLKTAVLNGLMIDEARLKTQAARERQSAEWRKFGSRDNRCVFLNEAGACQVYADRPSICRKHMVTTPASACTTEGAVVAPVQVLLAEILLSAELSLAGTEFGSLSKMLLKALQEGPTVRTAKPARITISAAAAVTTVARVAKEGEVTGSAREVGVAAVPAGIGES